MAQWLVFLRFGELNIKNNYHDNNLTIQPFTPFFLSFLLNSHYLFGQRISTQKFTLHLRPDFRGRVISFEPGLGQEHLPVSFHWHESARC